MAATTKKVALLVGSTRPVRVGPSVVEFIQKTLLSSTTSTTPPSLCTIDISSFALPVFNESVAPAMVPAQAQFSHAHSIAWSAAIAPFDGYIIVSPEYNYSVPGGVKNAIDYLYNEWIGKPIMIVTYGIQGGKNSNDHLKVILEGMKLRVVETRPQMKFGGEGMAEVFMAMGQGALGPKTVEAWEETAKEPLVKGFEELIAAMDVVPE